MRTLLLLGGLLGCMLTLQAQSLLTSPHHAAEGRIYAIDPDDARQLADGGRGWITEEWLQNVYATFPTLSNHYASDDLPPGHYITTRIINNEMEWRYLQVPNAMVYLENDQRKFMLKVLDLEGEVVTDAFVKIGEIVLPYDEITQTYILDARVQRGLVDVEVDGIRTFYNVDARPHPQSTNGKALRRHDQRSYSRMGPGDVLLRWVYSPVMRWTVQPVVYTMRLPVDLVFLAAKGRLYGWPRWIVDRAKLFALLTRRILHTVSPVSYLVCSQPRYRPGDTVKVKAYVTTANGTRLRHKAGLFTFDKAGQRRRLAVMHRNGPSSYTAEFVLTDSLNLQLDKDITMSMEGPLDAGDQRQLCTTTFHYEDYELIQYHFSLRAGSMVHWLGKNLVLYAEAKDMNGLTLPDARAKITVLPRAVASWQADRGFLRDTIWAWEGNLDPAGETRLEIPQDRLPPASLAYEVIAECWSSDNERKTTNLQLQYLHDVGDFKFTQTGHTLLVEYIVQGESTAREASYTANRVGQAPLTDKIALPASIRLMPSWANLSFSIAAVSKTSTYNIPTTDLAVTGQHRGDSLFIHGQSKSGSAYAWHLFENNREIAKGNAGEFKIATAAQARADYTVNVHGLAGGSSFSEDFSFHCPLNRLAVDWEGPTTIYPGMTADITVQVHDRKGKPVRKADLTAYAVNGRFEGAGAPKVSMQELGRQRERRHQKDYFFRYVQHSSHMTPLRAAEWALEAGLDTIPWYQFIYPGHHMYTYQYKIEPQSTELAPYVMRQGAIQPVQIVYIDGRPEYFAWSNPQLPYSFPVSSNNAHQIEIRLPEYVVKISGVVATAGAKTILSVDLDHLPPNATCVKTTPAVQPNETRIIQMYTMGYRNLYNYPAYCVLPNNRTFRLNYTSASLLGPITGPKIKLEVLDQFSHVLDYEEGFEFDFGPQLVKMRSLKPTVLPQTLQYSSAHQLTDRPWERDSLVAQWRRTYASPAKPTAPRPQEQTPIDWSRFYGSTSGRLLLEGLGTQNGRQVLFFHNNAAGQVYVVPLYNTPQCQAPLGKWGLTWMLDATHFVHLDSIEILPHGRNFMRLHYDKASVIDSVPAFIQKMIQSKPMVNASAPVPQPGTQHGSAVNPTIFSRTQSMSGKKTFVRGQVVDAETGEPLVTAVVYCLGFGIGAYTDLEGQFGLDIPVEADSILIRYLGYQDQIIRWKKETRLNIRLQMSSVQLESVEVTTHRPQLHTQQLSASMDVISAKKIDVQVSSNLQDALLQNSGVNIIASPQREVAMTSVTPAFPAELMAELEGKSVMRTHFSDLAIWEPDLRTDRHGNGKFKVHFPEDITRWDAYAVAVDRHGRAGLTQAAILSWKPIAGRLAMPRFLMAGDTCDAIGKSINYTGHTLQLRRRFQVNGRTKELAGACGPIQLDTLQLVAPKGADSLTLSYITDRADGYGDGEQLDIRVFPIGIQDSRGTMACLAGDTTLALSGFKTDGGPVKLFATTKFQELMLIETQKLKDYSHLCNEQLSSRLIALLSEETIFKSLGKPWGGADDVKACVNLLLKRVTPKSDIPWGWWPGMVPELWVSRHVMDALRMAQNAGYNMPLKMMPWIPGIMSQFRYQKGYYYNIEVLQTLQSIAPDLDIHDKIEALDTLGLNWVGARIAILELRQKAGLPISLDSLRKDIQFDAMRRIPRMNYDASYDGNLRGFRYPSTPYFPIEHVLTAYRIFRRAGQTPQELEPLLSYILYSRTSYGWGNTYQTAQVMLTLLPDVGKQFFTSKPQVSLVIDGKSQGLPMNQTLSLASVPDSLTVRKEGPGLVFFTAYQKWFNTEPTSADSIFEITSNFTHMSKPIAGDLLKAGEPTTLSVTLHVKRNMDYVMLEIPIPAGCSYLNKNNPFYSYGGGGCYQEYFKEKTVCYFRNLTAGVHYVNVQLQPRYTGHYALNSAHAEQMYMPLLSGQNAVRRVRIQ